MLDEIQKMVGFEYKIRLVRDGYYGAMDPKTKRWNGMIRELIDKVRKDFIPLEGKVKGPFLWSLLLLCFGCQSIVFRKSKAIYFCVDILCKMTMKPVSMHCFAGSRHVSLSPYHHGWKERVCGFLQTVHGYGTWYPHGERNSRCRHILLLQTLQVTSLLCPCRFSRRWPEIFCCLFRASCFCTVCVTRNLWHLIIAASSSGCVWWVQLCCAVSSSRYAASWAHKGGGEDTSRGDWRATIDTKLHKTSLTIILLDGSPLHLWCKW